jgi:hypothetical protein
VTGGQERVRYLVRAAIEIAVDTMRSRTVAETVTTPGVDPVITTTSPRRISAAGAHPMPPFLDGNACPRASSSLSIRRRSSRS